MKQSNLALLVIVTLIISSCTGSQKQEDTNTDYKPILKELTEQVILPTYSSLATNAAALTTSTNLFTDGITSEELEAARASWRKTRSPWEMSEGFLFGPADTRGIDPSIDSWPVNTTDLEKVLASSDSLTKDYVKALDGTLKGFHTIEYLLWGKEGNKTAEDFSAREIEYLTACSQVLTDDTKLLESLWNASDQAFASEVIYAGEGGNEVYKSQKSILLEFANGMLDISDEVGNGKINDPYEQKDLKLVESRFSKNSKQDLFYNITSIKNIYFGIFEGTKCLGISDIVAPIDASLDTQIKSEIDAAIFSIDAIPGTFSDAVFNNGPTIEAARQNVRKLQATLETKLLPLVSNL